MVIHHTKLKQAMGMGCHLSAVDAHKYRIFWPQRGVELFAPTVNVALTEMEAIQEILKNPNYRVITDGTGPLIRLINYNFNKQMAGTPDFPSVILEQLEAKSTRWAPITDDLPTPTIQGVPRSGSVAFHQGVPASDCPFMEEDPEFARWNDEWDEEADKEQEQEARPKGKGSVITNRYRANYAEMGHPTHCGDALALALNRYCNNKAGTNIEIFEAICAANDVDLVRYNRTTKGWQGRLRMTGRNLLARRVRENKGVLRLPEWLGEEFVQLDQDWLEEAEQKYKPKP